ncbi:zinc ribbon-containing protein [Mycoplasma sp. SG1]|uniref:zinc ribbon-containing protein n=1 Tax=Mycoplasma sp. SG1 TaxID=2810348 RepID=UPI002023C9A0|nr:zinc ribbon-containing protein [Mycoplasma sp. SG1]URM52870.1 zinc ribbon-containing protein [Mycoplasma sp. SG1]
MDQKIYSSGEAPGKGRYKCLGCPYYVNLEDGEELETCPMCGVEEYIKVPDDEGL